jgi:uncharacterized repeat protein (TIGR01451 family)
MVVSRGSVLFLAVLVLAGCTTRYGRPLSQPSNDPVSVTLEPAEATNPVMSEHKIKAVVKDKDGKPVHSALVEWTLARTPGAVGDIVSVTEDPWIRALKMDNTFAISGLDYNGESSITITAAREGTTYIIAHVPDIKDAAKQRAFAVKNWIDSKVEFPAATATNKTGTSHAMTLKVARSSDGAPLEGYDVHWKVTSGPAATFEESGRADAATRTDENGMTRATLTQTTPMPGVNNIEIVVSKGSDPRTACCPGVLGTIARGAVTKTWVAPPLSIDTSCPAATLKGETALFSYVVTNTSTGEASNVVVKGSLPAGFEYVSSSPDGTPGDGTVTWNLGSLPVGESRRLSVTARAVSAGSYKSEVTAKPAVGYETTAFCAADVTEPAVRISQACPPEGLAGDALDYRVTVWNPGTAAATNVVVSTVVPNGLMHASGRSELEWRIGDLGASESVSQTYQLTAQRSGTFSTTSRVTADRGLSDSADCSSAITAPAVAIRKSGPSERYLGKTATYSIVASNPGTAPATGVVVTDRIVPSGMSFVSANAGGAYNMGTGSVTWNVGVIPPGTERSVEVTLRADAEGRYCDTATVEAERGLRDSVETCTKIEGVPGVLMEVVDVLDPVEVGGTTTYTITVTNQGSTAATNLQVVATIPMEESYVAHTGSTNVVVSGRAVTFAPFGSLAPGQRFTHTVTVRGDTVGDARFVVDLSGDQLRGPVRREESTHIYRQQ